MRCLTPRTPEEFSAALAQCTEASRVIAGGTDYIIRMRQGKESPDLLIYPGQIPELHHISQTEDTLRIGAMVTMSEAAKAFAKQPAFRAIADAAANVGSPQIRNKATLVGNVCNASPAGDMLPVMLLYNAEVEILDAAGAISTMPVANFILGPGKTALIPGQAVTAVVIPKKDSPKMISAFRKIGSRQYVSIARESMGALLSLDSDGTITDAQLTLGAVSNTPIRIHEAEQLLIGQKLTHSLAEQLTPIVAQTIHQNCRPMNRLYKTEAARGLTADVFSDLLEQA